MEWWIFLFCLFGLLVVAGVGLFIFNLWSTVFTFTSNFLSLTWGFIKALCGIIMFKLFGPVPNITVRHLPIDQELVNPLKQGFKVQHCPPSIIVRRKVNQTLEVEIDQLNELCSWYSFPSVKFCVGRSSGRIAKLIICYNHIYNRGSWFRIACGQTDWAKYYGSIISAHIEVLKFSQRKRSHQLGVVGRIFKNYSTNIFEEVV